MLRYIPKDCILMPNTSGARNAEEAVRIARLARASGCGNFIKIEVISDNRYLLPDNLETIKSNGDIGKRRIYSASVHESGPYGCQKA